MTFGELFVKLLGKVFLNLRAKVNNRFVFLFKRFLNTFRHRAEFDSY